MTQPGFSALTYYPIPLVYEDAGHLVFSIPLHILNRHPVLPILPNPIKINVKRSQIE